MSFHYIFGMLSCVFLITACSSDSSSTSSTTSDATYRSVICPSFLSEQDDVTCGRLNVAESRAVPDSARLELMVARISANNPDTTLPPVVYLAGGPGGPAVATIGVFLDGGPVAWLREKQDLIVVDQRGAGYSTPSMHCPEADGFPGSTNGVAECRARLLSEGRDLLAYNTAENAKDMEDLRLQMGIDRWDLYGLSYGTTLAIEIMRNYSSSIRSVVLDSAYPPQINSGDDEIYGTLWTVEQIAVGCNTDPACDAAFPALRTDIDNAIAKFDADPVPTAALALPEQFGDAPLDGVGLLELLKSAYAEPFAAALINAMATQSRDSWIPFLVALASDTATGSEEVGNLAVAIQTDIGGTGSGGMNHSVICSEELLQSNPPALDLSSLDWSDDIVSRLRAQSDTYADVCRIWNVPALDSSVSLPVTSSIPTLVLSGTADSSTPLPNATETLRTLANGYLAKIPDGGHGVFDNPCTGSVVTEFLGNPASAPVASCTVESHLRIYATQLEQVATGDEGTISLYEGLLPIPASAFHQVETVTILNQISDQISARFSSQGISHSIAALDNGARYTDADYNDPVTRMIAVDIISMFAADADG